MVDLKDLAAKTMATAQENLKRDGGLTPVAVLVTHKGQVLVGLSFNGLEQKHAAYEAVALLARRNRALAVVTVNDARMSMFKDSDAAGLTKEEQRERVEEFRDAPTFRWQSECIVVAVKAPGAAGYALVCPYQRSQEQFIFKPVEDFAEADIFMVPDWP